MEQANKVLKESGFRINKTLVVAVEVSDRPGGLHSIMKFLGKESINVEYLYDIVEKSGENAVIIFRFGNTEKAIEVLRANKFTVIP